jgi:hypothetical protein
LLKICAFIMMQLFISLFVVYIQQTYHSKAFKKINIITLKKVDKRDYTISKTYRSIALLNIIEKILKFIMSKKISWITKTHRLLLDTFMKCRKNRSIETTLKLFIEQIHIVWEQKTNRMITLLNLNVTNVFDTMSHVKLRHDMKKRKISRWIIDWINNFLFDRFTTFAMNRKAIESFSMQIEISQKSSLFSILYLFYNVDLLKMCNKFETNTKFLEYVDNVNILIYEKSIEKNCRNLKKMHKLCERWAIRHEFVFVSIKYELIHFIKNSRKFDMTITIRIDSNTIQSRIDIRIFDVQIDTRLKWDSHVRKIQKKMTKQIMIFTKLSIFIWRTIFHKTRMLYIFVVRFVFIYDVFVWHMLKNKKSKMINKLAIIQNRCLRSIFESFRIISISILKVESHVAFIDLHLNQLQIQIKYRMQIASISNIIRRECKSITSKLNNDSDKSRMHKFTSSELKHEWVTQQLIDKQTSSIAARFAFWTNSMRFDHDAIRFNNQRKRKMYRFHMNRWKKKWTEYAFFVLASISIQIDFVDKKRLKLHDQLKKIESFLTIQICIEKINFASFLHRRKILDVKSIFCRCDWSNQTIKHVIMFCSLMSDRNQLFKNIDINDYHVMTHSSKKFKTIVKWLMQHNLLQQFSLITELLYEL